MGARNEKQTIMGLAGGKHTTSGHGSLTIVGLEENRYFLVLYLVL